MKNIGCDDHWVNSGLNPEGQLLFARHRHLKRDYQRAEALALRAATLAADLGFELEALENKLSHSRL